MMRDDIIAEISKVSRTCRGEASLAQEDRDSLMEEWYKVSDDASMAAFSQRLAQYFPHIAIPSEPSLLLVQTLVYSFQENCGADFNEIICSYPFDGRTRTIACPSCGCTQVFQSPLLGS